MNSNVILPTILIIIYFLQPKLAPNGKRRIVLFYAWLTAKPRHIRKYAKLMTDLGVDVLVVRSYPLDVMTPINGSQVRWVGHR